MLSDVDVQSGQEVGLRLPDGQEIYPPNTWHGRGMSTNEDRKVILDALTQSALNLSIDPAELLGRYAWLIRDHQTITINVPGLVSQLPLDNEPLTHVEPTEAEPFLEADVVEEQSGD